MTFSSLPAHIQDKVQQWLSGPYDAASKAELCDLINTHPEELIERFTTDLAFGTAGARALMGVGSSRMNKYTVEKLTHGLARYMRAVFPNTVPLKVVIGYDARHNSLTFAQSVAHTLICYGIDAFLFQEMRPTPMLSFAVRLYQAHAGVMITASHNSAAYNGYKVYWQDGGQIVAPRDEGIMYAAAAVPTTDLFAACPASIVALDTAWIDDRYVNAIASLQHFPSINKQEGHCLSIIYTSLHGVGITVAPRAFQEWGFSSLYCVPSQVIPHPDFPTAPNPNPQDIKALEMGTEMLLAKQADLLIAHDPDADRIGCVALHHNKAVFLTGSQLAALCATYLAQQAQASGTLDHRSALITTIVTNEILKSIAAHYQCQCYEVFTGFKYIAELIHKWEQEREGSHLLFAAEESHGYLAGTYTRDKDGIAQGCIVAEMALQLKKCGRTLIDQLHSLYSHYGAFGDLQRTLLIPTGTSYNNAFLEQLKQACCSPSFSLAGKEVVIVEDYALSQKRFLKSGVHEPLECPKSDVLMLRLSDGTRIVIRPSGTEPKIKLYASCSGRKVTHLEETLEEIQRQLAEALSSVEQFLVASVKTS